MRHLFAVSIISLAVGSLAAAAPAPQESWGKAGITLVQYRQDSLECGLKGYYTDISQTQDAKVFVKASRQLDAVTTGATAPMTVESNAGGPDTTNTVDQMEQFADQQHHIVESVHADERFHSIKHRLESKADECLMQRGYSKFRLTDEQRHRLIHLKAGSEDRREYLYTLASNPAVLQDQKAPAQR